MAVISGKKLKFLLIAVLVGVLIWYFNFRLPITKAAARLVVIESRGFSFQILTDQDSVERVLQDQGLLVAGSQVRPEIGDKISGGMKIVVLNPVAVRLSDAGRMTAATSTAVTVGEFLERQSILLGPRDEVSPAADSLLYQDMTVTIRRINEVEEEKNEPVIFATKTVDDPDSLYGEKTEIQAGKDGTKKVKYFVRYRDGVEVSRKVLSSQITAAPIDQIIRTGAKEVVESYESGRASWYAYKKCLCAAHPFFPKGSYLRVTAVSTGKNIIVRVNDFGPDQGVHPGRILDLDAEAFKKLAPLGAGTIEVKVEKLKSD